ncbi:MAG: cation diffusion facilitator family transporter [Stackebrandtia sp.]
MSAAPDPHHDHSERDHHCDHHRSGADGRWHRLKHAITPHSHDTADQVDAAMESSRDGMRALWISLAGLGATAIAQAVVVTFTGSVALLGDTLHNIADALTAIPLGLAFWVGRRAANRRFTYGYGRAEDLAGIVIVVFIAVSAVTAGLAAIDRLRHPAEVSHLWAVGAAGLVGFIGNELVARYRINVGKRIGSAALVADGLHARTDGFTSLAVLAGAGGVALGWNWADPIIGLVITVMIVVVLKDAALEVFRRLMDAVDPGLVDTAEAVLADVPGVREVAELRLRWVGHQLHAETDVVVDPRLSVAEGHTIAVEAEHRLIHAIPRLTRATIHTDPHLADAHQALDHHR